MFNGNTRQNMELNNQRLFEIREEIEANRLKASIIRRTEANKQTCESIRFEIQDTYQKVKHPKKRLRTLIMAILGD